MTDTPSLAAAARAAQAAAQGRADAATAASHAAEAAELVPLLSDFFGTPATHLDTLAGTHPVEHGYREQFNYSVGRDWHRVHRFRVADLTFWWLVDLGSRRGGQLELELACRSCGQSTSQNISELNGYEVIAKPDEDHYERARTAAAVNKRLVAIGKALTSEPPLCWDCKIGVPHTCPTCGRSNNR
jgi:hypothetical protein